MRIAKKNLAENEKPIAPEDDWLVECRCGQWIFNKNLSEAGRLRNPTMVPFVDDPEFGLHSCWATKDQ